MSLNEDERRFFTQQGRSCDAADFIAKARLELAASRALEAVGRWEDAEGHICIAANERVELAADIAKSIRGASR